MVAVGQHNLTICLHAYTTFFFSFNVYIWKLSILIVIPSPVPLHTYSLLLLIFCVSDTILKLKQRRINYSCPLQRVVHQWRWYISRTHQNHKKQTTWKTKFTIELSNTCFPFMSRHGGCAVHINLPNGPQSLGHPHPWLENKFKHIKIYLHTSMERYKIKPCKSEFSTVQELQRGCSRSIAPEKGRGARLDCRTSSFEGRRHRTRVENPKPCISPDSFHWKMPA